MIYYVINDLLCNLFTIIYWQLDFFIRPEIFKK